MDGQDSIWHRETGDPERRLEDQPKKIVLLAVQIDGVHPLPPFAITEDRIRALLKAGKDVLYVDGARFHGTVTLKNGTLHFVRNVDKEPEGDKEMKEARRPEFSKEVARYYQTVAEEGRLAAGPSQLEFARAKEVVLRYLPPPPGIILDVGGAGGTYALWLAEMGYQVHLIDAVPRLVEVARRRSEVAPNRISTCQVGDARELTFDDGVADGVLLLGPLYHLTETAERHRALQETYRVLRPGGVMFAAAISRYASALDGIARDLFADASFAAIVQQDLERGQHRNETDNWDYFTTAYFHRPDELQVEVVSAGFNCQAVFGLEGPGWVLSDFDERWADARKREDLLRVARALERETSIVGLSAHLLALGTKE